MPIYDIFNRISTPIDSDNWDTYFEKTIKPLLMSNPGKAQQWVNVAQLPYDDQDPVNTILLSAKDVLRYAILNLLDAAEQLGGFPFEIVIAVSRVLRIPADYEIMAKCFPSLIHSLF